jgi:Ca2+-binding EF-hand superfamily protein
MHKVGHDISSLEVNEIMRKHDSKRNGYISYEEFKLMLYDFKA